MARSNIRAATRAEVEAVATPAATKNHSAAAHGVCLLAVEHALAAGGYKIREANYLLGHHGKTMSAALDLKRSITPGVSLVVGVHNSFNRTSPLALQAGIRVAASGSLAYFAKVTVRMRTSRPGQVRFAEAVSAAVATLSQYRAHESERIGWLARTSISDVTAEALMLRAFEQKLATVQTLPAIILEWRRPVLAAFRPRTAWSLLNAFTTVLNARWRTSTEVHAALTIGIGRLFDETFGVQPFVLTSEAGGVWTT